MSVRPYYDIWCDHPDCAEWEPGATGHSVRECRRNAKALGWVNTRGADLCPMHRPNDPVPPAQWDAHLNWNVQVLTPDPTYQQDAT